MNITFLGTAASEGYPNAFCSCANCEHARALGGPSLRKRSALLINDDLLIDLGPDLMAAALMHGRSLAGLRYCLQTHAHADHLDPSHFLSRSPECGVSNTPTMHFYASAATAQRAAQILAPDVAPGDLLDAQISARLNVEIHQIGAFQTFRAGPYRVTTFAANHDMTLDPLLYAIESDDHHIFYGTDTGELFEETWAALRKYQRRFNVVILDHTFGTGPRVDGHMNFAQFLEQVARMRAAGMLAHDARIFAHHLAHHSNPVHPELVVFAAQRSYEVAYDGLVVTLA